MQGRTWIHRVQAKICILIHTQPTSRLSPVAPPSLLLLPVPPQGTLQAPMLLPVPPQGTLQTPMLLPVPPQGTLRAPMLLPVPPQETLQAPMLLVKGRGRRCRTGALQGMWPGSVLLLQLLHLPEVQ